MSITKAVIPAAGLGTRLLPATKAQPKEMLPVVDKPVIQYVVEEAVSAGITDILIITGRGKRALEDHFDQSYELEKYLEARGDNELLGEVRHISSIANIHYVRQSEPKGLGDAILCARQHVSGEPFAVMLGDDVFSSEVPVIKQMISFFELYQNPVVAVREVPHSLVRSYGVIKGNQVEDNVFKVADLVEKPAPEEAPSNLAITGRYILTSEIFNALTRTESGVGGEIQLTDALKLLKDCQSLYAVRLNGQYYDLGSKLSYLKATVEFALQRKDIGLHFRRYLEELL